MRHHAAIPVDEMPAFMTELRAKSSITGRALETTILCASRSAEVLGAKWEEFDLDNATWTIPPSRMKKRKAHIVPLSRRVLAILKDLSRLSDYVFPGTRQDRPLGDGEMLDLLQRMHPGATVHGCRSAFHDWAGDRTSFSHEVIEFALAHSVPDRTTAAYRRYTALPKRRALMEQWAQFCESPAAAGNVTLIRRAGGAA